MGGLQLDVSVAEDKADVYRSADGGATWSLATGEAGWGPRRGLSVVTLADDTVLVIGGRTGDTYHDDVWQSVDHGQTFQMLRDNAPWPARAVAGAVVLADGTLLLMGGLPGLNDVWSSASGGSVWNVVTQAAAWSPRAGFGVGAMGDGSVVLVGGGVQDDALGTTGDVWRSVNKGAAWHMVAAASPWVRRVGMAFGVLGGGVLVLSGGTTGMLSPEDVWISIDSGASWTRQAGASVAGSRRYPGATTLPGNTFLIVGGDTDSGVAGVWAGAAGPEWSVAACTDHHAGMREARPRSAAVSISLPAASGAINPANAESAKLNVVYSPPLATMTMPSGAATVEAGVALVHVAFTSAVTGLSGAAFVVTDGSQSAALMSSSLALAGSGAAYTVSLALGGDVAMCPTGYTWRAYGGGGYCARALTVQRDWDSQNAACGPYTLTSVATSAQHGLVVSMRSSTADYW